MFRLRWECELFAYCSRCHIDSYAPLSQIPPTVTEAVLRNHFKKCGPIEDICIRCSSGTAVLIGQAHPCRTPRDRQYATIMFNRPNAVAKALKLNKSEIHSFQIRVRLVLKDSLWICWLTLH
jgi:RNA recognition motif-containing protein